MRELQLQKLNENYSLSVYTHIIARDERTIVCNTGNGMFIRMPTQCWEVVQKYISFHTPQEVCNVADEDDREYYEEIYSKLINAKILVREEEHIEEVYLMLTNRCNLNCAHCCADASGMEGEDELSTGEWFEIIDILIELGVERIAITGGEPLVRKDFWEILDYLYRNFHGDLALSTNGLLINETNVNKIMECFASINISLDGYDEESCSKIRGRGVFTKVIKKVKLLKERGYETRRISLSMVETSVTYQGIDKFEELCKELQVKPIMRKFSATGRGADNAKWLRISEEEIMHGMYAKDEKLRQELDISCLLCQNCAAGRTKLSINQRGDIFPCAVLDSDDFCLGNILKDKNVFSTIRSQWCKEDKSMRQSEGLQAFNKLLIKNMEKCAQCDVAPFCIMCLETFFMNKEKYGIDAICDANREFLSEVVWKS